MEIENLTQPSYNTTDDAVNLRDDDEHIGAYSKAPHIDDVNVVILDLPILKKKKAKA